MDFPVNKKKVKAYYDLSSLGMTQRIETYKHTDSLYENKLPLVNNNYIFGLEIEMEEIHTGLTIKQQVNYWNAVPDNSLRNAGIEFVSVPLKAIQIEKALNQLQMFLPEPPVFSERTSTHVHMNVRDLTLEQIAALVIVYTSVEKLLFNWVGHNRDKNIFCIPLNNTDFHTLYRGLCEDPPAYIRSWQKYTSLNLLPLVDKGTVEFRHLYGTWDKEIIITWINFLSSIKQYVKRNTIKSITETIFALNTNSLYEEYVYSIFKEYAKVLLADITDLPYFLEDSVTYCKLVLHTDNQRQIDRLGPARLVDRATMEAMARNPRPEAVVAAPREPVERTQAIRMRTYVTRNGTNLRIPEFLAPPIEDELALFGGMIAARANIIRNNLITYLQKAALLDAWQDYFDRTQGTN